ncbi:hypothetical protein QFZ67_007564 [Streptomyces sp. V1I1]|nr:hypothetical protein [Streptomyces sp. V1I1]
MLANENSHDAGDYQDQRCVSGHLYGHYGPSGSGGLPVATARSSGINHAGYLWAFARPNGSPGARAHYRRRRDQHGGWHAAALRNLFNRMLGQLYHCLQHGHRYEEALAFPSLPEALGRRTHRCQG